MLKGILQHSSPVTVVSHSIVNEINHFKTEAQVVTVADVCMMANPQKASLVDCDFKTLL